MGKDKKKEFQKTFDIQKWTDDAVKKIDEQYENKEKDIMQV